MDPIQYNDSVRFWKNDPSRKKFKIFSESFHRDTDRRFVFKFHEIWPNREIGEIVRCLPDEKKFAWLSNLQLSLLIGSRPKSATASPTM